MSDLPQGPASRFRGPTAEELRARDEDPAFGEVLVRAREIARAYRPAKQRFQTDEDFQHHLNRIVERAAPRRPAHLTLL